MPIDEEFYRNVETFETVETLPKNTKNEPETTTMIFDFKDNAFILQPGKTKEPGEKQGKSLG